MVVVIISIIVGCGIGLFVPCTISSELTQYVAIGILACFDTVFGGIYAEISKKFDIKIFITGFFSNGILACAIIWLGNILGVDLSIAAIVVFGARLFDNFSKIRQKLLQNK